MRLLLDTHALLWWLADDTRLGAQARRLLSDPTHDVLVSAVSLWEIVVKQRVGKLEADIDEIAREVRNQGFPLLDIRIPHLLTLSVMKTHHKDPFDHLLMAQAIVEGAAFVTDDHNAARYDVRLISCSA